MPNSIRRIIPSMYLRRLWLLGLGAAAITAVLALQLSRLTLAQGAAWYARAESSLTQRRLVPTVRGRILDSKGRVLALDQASFDVAVAYPLINNQWSYQQARRAAFRNDRDLWRRLDRAGREQLVAQYEPAFNDAAQLVWNALAHAGRMSTAQLEERKDTITRRVQQIASEVWVRRMDRGSRELDDEIPLSEIAEPIEEQKTSHPLLFDADDPARLFIERQIALAGDPARLKARPELAAWKNVSIQRSWKRSYPLLQIPVSIDRSNFPSPLRQSHAVQFVADGAAIHLIGQLRDIWKEDVTGTLDSSGNVIKPGRPFKQTRDGKETIDLGGYLPGDAAGRWGIEKSMEPQLRGLRGQVMELLDVQQEIRVEPVAGKDVALTIDVQLQARIQAVMSPALGLMADQPWHHGKQPSADPGRPLNGAALVLDVATGQVLAAVSIPTFTLRQLHDAPESVWNDPINRPFLNRPIAFPYEPGSTVKPIILAAAVTQGVYQPDQTITCSGHLEPQAPSHYRCWIYKQFNSTHGPLAGSEAIARSCNIFFYTLGRNLGAPNITQWYQRFGLGASTSSGLDEEITGDLPDLRLAANPNAPGFSQSDAAFMGIGQGPVRFTLVQLAAAYAALANHGNLIKPTFIASIAGVPQQSTSQNLGLDPRGIDQALQGLYDTVNQSYGTASRLPNLGHEPVFNIPGVRVMGKTGTADAAALFLDSNNDRRITAEDTLVRKGDHAWFIGLVQRPDSPTPNYVIAVVVEYAASGTTVAAPIANQIIHALRAEGHL